MEITNYMIKVTGRVQGVWFRKYTKEKADELGIRGYAKNNLDGSVSISAEATKEVLQEFINWLHTGSPLSVVEDIVYEESLYFKGDIDFNIL